MSTVLIDPIGPLGLAVVSFPNPSVSREPAGLELS